MRGAGGSFWGGGGEDNAIAMLAAGVDASGVDARSRGSTPGRQVDWYGTGQVDRYPTRQQVCTDR